MFVGHSVSAMIGVLAANLAPERFAHLVLVGPSPRYIDDPETGYVGGFARTDIDEPARVPRRPTTSAGPRRWHRRSSATPTGPSSAPSSPRASAAPTRTSSGGSRQATFLSDNRSDLASVRVPCLVLQCSDDIIAPTAVGRYVHDQLPKSELVVLRATGHCPNLSAPDETAEVIGSYLRSAA